MGHAAVAMMRDTPAAAATAAENSTAANSSTLHSLGSVFAGDGAGQSACGGWDLDAWMLGWFIRRLPYHSLATCFASGTGVQILDDRPRPK